MNIRINHMQLINKENDHTLAICEIILNECFRIRGVKLMFIWLRTVDIR